MRNPFTSFWNLLTKPFRTMRELAALTDKLTRRVTELESRATAAETRARKAESRSRSLEKTLAHERNVHAAKVKKARQKARQQNTVINDLRAENKTLSLNLDKANERIRQLEDGPIEIGVDPGMAIADRIVKEIIEYINDPCSDLCNDARNEGLESTNDPHFWDNVIMARRTLPAALGRVSLKRGIDFNVMREKLVEVFVHQNEADVYTTIADFFEVNNNEA